MTPRNRKRTFRFASRTPGDVRAEIRAEFEFHLEMRTEDLIASGLSPEAARNQALAEFGNEARGAVGCAAEGDRLERRRQLSRLAADLKQDAIVGLRLLVRSPGFAAVATLMLALAIGANAAIFSALDAVFLRPLPFPQPDRLVHVYETRDDGGSNSVSGGAFRDWREHQKQFDSLTILAPVSYNLRTSGTLERLNGMEVSHEFLRVFGLQPILGRDFLPENDRPGGHNDVVIITEELWRSRLGGSAAIAGSTIVLDEVPRTVIGVLPARAWTIREAQFFVPVVLSPDRPRSQRSPHWGAVFGRLEPNVSLLQAESELESIKAQLNDQYPTFKRGWGVGLRPVRELLAKDPRPVLLMLLGAVGLVLLIACANVANLLLARACHRRQEIAIRSALGATGGRIVRQVLTESVVLALLGGAAGIALAYWGVELLKQTTGELIPGPMALRLDARVLAFSMAITGVTGLLFGVLPAWRVRRPDLTDALKNGGKNATAGGRQRTQSLLIVAEVSLTVVLLTVTGLLLRSLANTATADPGFEPARAVAIDLSLPRVTYTSDEQRLAFSANLLERIRALPGIESAGSGMAIPFAEGGYGEYFRRPDRANREDFVLGRVDYISEQYLEALGTRVLAGRRLTGTDNRPNGRRVAVVNETAARTFYAGENAIGRSINIAGTEWEIVGVIADVADVKLDLAHRPVAYLPQAFNTTSFSMVVRTRLDPLSTVGAIRDEIRRLDPGVALANVRSLDQARADSMRQRRFSLGLIAIFSAVALTLACIGLYGVMAYSVAARQRELSIRMALGALRRDIVVQILADGVRLMGVGLIIGLVGAFGAAQLVSNQLYQVSTYDSSVILSTIIAVTAVAVAAIFVPAWKATRFNEITALRSE
jgi:putative ABC transport system permease protein